MDTSNLQYVLHIPGAGDIAVSYPQMPEFEAGGYWGEGESRHRIEHVDVDKEGQRHAYLVPAPE